MLVLLTPCEPPKRSVWHFVSGVAVLSMAWTFAVVAFQWWTR
ncbi:MAG TPA: hypothetical protein VF595_15250 [Tepidisphaeraceae bacterium]|jgi:hypothetical protein